MDNVNEAECSCCGAVMNVELMERMCTGRRVQYLCPECYGRGGAKADQVFYRTNRYRQFLSKKVNK